MYALQEHFLSKTIAKGKKLFLQKIVLVELNLLELEGCASCREKLLNSLQTGS